MQLRRPLAAALAAAAAAQAQIPPELLQQQQQQQQGAPLLFTFIDAVARGSGAVTTFATRHPKLCAAALAGLAVGVYVKRELPRSGLAVRREPHLSLAPPSDEYMAELLLLAAEDELSNPLPCVTRPEEDTSDGFAGGRGWKLSEEKIVLGKGAALYRKAAADLEHFDQWDGLEGAELVLASGDDGTDDKANVGATVGVLQRVGPFWCVSPLRVVYKTRTQPPPSHAAAAPPAADEKPSSGERSSGSYEGGGADTDASSSHSSNVYVTEYGLSTVRGAGWRGEWRFAVTFDADTEEVVFEVALARARGGGAVVGRRQGELLQGMASGMRQRAQADAALVEAREKQRERFKAVAAEAEKRRAEKLRDRVLHPEKYERKHVFMEGEDTAIRGSGRGGGREARWGSARRSDDLDLRSGH